MADDAQSSEKRLEKEILDDAHKRAERAVKRATRDAQKLTAEAEKNAEEEAQKILEQSRERARKQRAVILATVDIEIEKRRVARQEEMIKSVFDEALKRLRETRSYDYRQSVIQLASDALGKMQGNEYTIRLRTSDERFADDSLIEAIREKLNARDFNLRIETSSADAGPVVESSDGRQVYNNSFDARLRRLQDPLRKRVAETIFEESGKQHE
jgi:V/A-type H+-transporting ATPase subunit E